MMTRKNMELYFPTFRKCWDHSAPWLRGHAAAVFLVVILGVGSYARWTDLAWHFSNNDDMRGIRTILEQPKLTSRIFALPVSQTNAPFQFIYTSFLLSSQMDYRELLFWGRLPSCVMGILALFAMVYFYRRWEPQNRGMALLGLALLACSWENIAYAKQTYSYAIGVLALTLMLGFFAEFTERAKLSLGRLLALSFGLALLSNMQYQIHIFIPPFFCVLFLYQWPHHENKKTLVLHFLFAAFLYAALMAPTWYFFLWNKLGRGVPPPGTIPDPEQVLVLQKGASLWKHLNTAVFYYARNLFLVFQSKIGFFPETHPAFQGLSWFFFGLFLLGVFRCVLARDERRRLLGIFLILSLMIWWSLTAFQKMRFYATRHTLILLPFFCVMVTEGASFLAEKAFSLDGRRLLMLAKRYFVGGLALGVLVVFLIFFGQFRRERRDLTDGKELLRLFRIYDPELFVFNDQTFGLKEMKELNAYMQAVSDRQGPASAFSTIAFISRYSLDRVTLEQCEMARAFYNREHATFEKKTGRPQGYLRYPCQDYKKVYSREVRSKVQTDFTERNPPEMYTNSLYLYIFRRKQTP